MSNLVTVFKEKYGREFMSIEELALELGVQAEDVMGEINNGNLKCVKLFGKIRIKIEELEYILKECEVNENEYQETLDQMATTTVTCQQVQRDTESIEDVEIWEDDKNMVKGSITYVKGKGENSGRWMYQLTLGKLENGKRHRVSKSFKTEQEAREALQTELDKFNSRNVIASKEQLGVNKDTSEVSKVITFNEAVANYFTEIIDEGQVSSRTLKSYRDDLNPIVECFGEYFINEITKEEVRRLFNTDTFKKYTKNTTKKKWNRLKAVFERAYEDKYIQGNIFESMKMPKKQEKQKLHSDRIYTNETIELIKELSYSNEEYKILNIAFNILETTGMRPSELRALTWDDINFEKNLVTINKAIVRQYDETVKVGGEETYKECVGDPKTEASNRWGYLSEGAKEVLLEWKLDPRTKASKHIMCNGIADFISEDELKRLLEKFINDYKLKDKKINFYKFRHSLCTKLVLEQKGLHQIKDVMGHSSMDMINKVYTHLEKGSGVNVVKQVFEEEEVVNS